MLYTLTCILNEAVLIVASNEGITHLYLGESEEALLDQHSGLLKSHARDDKHPLFQQVMEYLDDTTRPIPSLSLSGTPFQELVWSEIRNVSKGETITYSELAERIGRPLAVRAVASACGKNEVSLLIPCHRVVGKNGSISGYRWGVDIKKRLLEREQLAN